MLISSLKAGSTGPTLLFDYGRARPLENPVNSFMYFVPLISPEPVSVFLSATNTQQARVISHTVHISGNSFLATCDFEFRGTGFQRNVFDHTNLIREHEKELKSGKTLTKQLAAINVEGSGRGYVEVEGSITNGLRTVNCVRMHFNSAGTSPVLIRLQDICYRDGKVRFENEIIARVNALGFRMIDGVPKMDATLASVNSATAADSTWQSIVGAIKGAAANLLLKPQTVEADGHRAMLDFGLALVNERMEFTFPFATRLKETAGSIR